MERVAGEPRDNVGTVPRVQKSDTGNVPVDTRVSLRNAKPRPDCGETGARHLAELMLELDADGSGDVDFEEFYEWYERRAAQLTGGAATRQRLVCVIFGCLF